MNGTYKENRMNSQRPAARRQTVNMRNVYVASFFAAAAAALAARLLLFWSIFRCASCVAAFRARFVAVFDAGVFDCAFG
ncbi:hypothetical protein, partial [Ruminococcus sp.]|uniref:hypothetical protein n=1 Tax=Ruminococcus sp. TaxID=41978 RepID=UPI003AB56F99